MMVAVGRLHTEWLREALDGQADVEFVDMEELGRNPAQIIPAWQQFLDRSGGFVPYGVSGSRSGLDGAPRSLLSVSCTKPC